jgi:hypothetical protein
MIIPLSNKPINIGDIVTTIREMNESYCIISKGHDFIVIDINGYGFILKDIESNIIFERVQKNEITLKLSIIEARTEFILSEEEKEYKKFISSNCINRKDDYDYDVRRPYDSCSLKKVYNDSCVPCLECSKYLDKDKIKESKLLQKYIRKSKLDKLI